MAVIFAFGDSITYGEWDIDQSGWVEQLRKDLDSRMLQDPDFYALVYNLGIPGEATDGLVKRFKSEVKARLRKGEEYGFVFAYGANDVTWIPTQNRFRITTEEYIQNLQKVMSQARVYSGRIILLNTTPVIDELTKNPEGKDKSRENQNIQIYNHKLKEFADANNITLVDVNSAFVNNDNKNLFVEDGLHPNETGHQIIFNLVRDKIDPWLS